MNGKFIISLDFELHWGVFDTLSLEHYEENLKNVKDVIHKLIILSDKYGIKLTFATVGFLFASNKKEIKEFTPSSLPKYTDKNLNPYRLLSAIGDNENDSPLHFAKSVIESIKQNGNHEIGSHTFSHYYCLESGQNSTEFDADIKAAKKIANTMGIKLTSIVFPKNQVNKEHLKICANNGITNFRGTEKHKIYNYPNFNTKSKKILRFIDNYFNLCGYNTYNIDSLTKSDSELINLPSSRFLRPFLPKLAFLEFLKLNRIKKAMKHAAIKNELYHLWWHPHNFGTNIDKNLNNLESIFKTYAVLNKQYKFKSVTMTELANEILNNKSLLNEKKNY
ncbi:polysaccharide deacetylase family protein [uncultured Algibacter sp.]|uniref:polysaccharide deacetylase family protein n=1 Tax=uncultured Algibacter sp. TaxID=298659 RepID=UPI002616BEA2|nr:polysaccharide deacetylase family protein [uncultured Algibacter sp.]